MTTITFSIPNISCDHCVHTIQSELSDLAGVVKAEAWADKKEARVTFEPPATEEKIKALLTEINYPPAQV